MHLAITFDVAQMQLDMTRKGWNDADLAKRAGVAPSSVGRFWSGDHRTPGMAKKLTKALGRKAGHYLVQPKVEGAVA